MVSTSSPVRPRAPPTAAASCASAGRLPPAGSPTPRPAPPPARAAGAAASALPLDRLAPAETSAAERSLPRQPGRERQQHRDDCRQGHREAQHHPVEPDLAGPRRVPLGQRTSKRTPAVASSQPGGRPRQRPVRQVLHQQQPAQAARFPLPSAARTTSSGSRRTPRISPRFATFAARDHHHERRRAHQQPEREPRTLPQHLPERRSPSPGIRIRGRTLPGSPPAPASGSPPPRTRACATVAPGESRAIISVIRCVRPCTISALDVVLAHHHVEQRIHPLRERTAPAAPRPRSSPPCYPAAPASR